jgi:hypothetical protein
MVHSFRCDHLVTFWSHPFREEAPCPVSMIFTPNRLTRALRGLLEQMQLIGARGEFIGRRAD